LQRLTGKTNHKQTQKKQDFKKYQLLQVKTAMTKRQLKHFDLIEAKKAYKEGRNITELLRSQKNINLNTSEIIETAYDLQAGSYIEAILNNHAQAQAYTTELASILDNHITKTTSLLDIGTGELTTLSHLICKLTKKPKKVFAFDISWSRIYKGKNYAKEVMGADYKILKLFVCFS
jgi:SAM-dependent methyltransferase